ncbi:MAG: hypothetical protein MZV49_04425 [Rhodopseudomonas palustris]|nr:hypothetical protein [Rhodopseudomonas palustris]
MTIMGHVDHGKTSLLDAHPPDQRGVGRSRRHHPAYRRLSGDAAERAARSPSSTRPATPPSPRCAPAARKVTDIVVLVVAADDGVMPQTVEAINHAKAAERADDRGDQQDRQARRRPGAACAPSCCSTRSWSRAMGGDVLDVEVSATNEDQPRQAARDDRAAGRNSRPARPTRTARPRAP